jgi:hypothetical protein
MGKIGDLFVRLGLKSDGFKKGMTDAKKETQSFGSKLGQMKAGALAVWAAIGTAVVKFSQDFISATNKIGDAWETQMRGMKAAYNSVLADFTNYKPDTSSIRNFFKGELEWIKKTFGNAKESADAGKEAAKAFDAEFELTQSVTLQRKQIQHELNELYAIMRDTSKSNEIRKNAQERYKALLQPIADAEVAVYSNMLDAAITEWQAGTGLNRTRDEIVEFFSKIGIETEAMAAKFPDIYDVFNNRKGDKTNLPIFDIIGRYQDAANQMSNVEKEMARVTNAINADIKRGLDAQVKEIAKAANEKLKLDLKLDLEIDTEELDWSALDAEIEAFANGWNEHCLEIKALNDMLEQSFIDSFSGGTQALTDMLMGVEGADASQVMAAILQPMARTATQLGEMLIAEGLGIKAFKDSLKTLKPEVAFAAGATLIAVGAALSSGIKALGTSGGTAGTTAAAGTTATSGTQTLEQEITVNVVGEISGDKIILAGQKTLNKWSR